jgi:NAD(P)-dependent dehydrogenase (short-subunit alcohol dehydrogenase family)
MQAVKNTIAENMGGIAHNLAPADSQFDIDKDVPDLSGKVAVTTGGSQGIGYAASFVMLRANLSKLFILSTDQSVIDGALKDISEKLSPQHAQRVTWIQNDLSDWPAVAKAAKTITSQTDRLDILLLNSARGIMTQEITSYGVDRHMAVNHIGHVILCSHLLPLLKKTSESSTVRIQIQGSNAHEMAPKDTSFSSLEEINRDTGPNGNYGTSKLANILYARYLNRHLHASHPNILINATHPGFVETKMSKDDIHEPYPILGYGMSAVMHPIKKDQWMGSASTLFAATKTESSGEYVCPPAIVEPGSEIARSEEVQENLMKLTRELVTEKLNPQKEGCPMKDY